MFNDLQGILLLIVLLAPVCGEIVGLVTQNLASDVMIDLIRKCKLLIEQPDVCLVYSQQHFTQDN